MTCCDQCRAEEAEAERDELRERIAEVNRMTFAMPDDVWDLNSYSKGVLDAYSDVLDVLGGGASDE